jgi:predicted nucleic acid-binding protein
MALKRICLDTSAYSHFKRNAPKAVQIINAAREVFVPTVVLGELRTGFRLGGRAVQNEKELGAFLAVHVVSVVDIDNEVSSIYADLMTELRTSGRPLPANDIWIAACAIKSGAILVTYNEHFTAIHRVGSEILS